MSHFPLFHRPARFDEQVHFFWNVALSQNVAIPPNPRDYPSLWPFFPWICHFYHHLFHANPSSLLNSTPFWGATHGWDAQGGGVVSRWQVRRFSTSMLVYRRVIQENWWLTVASKNGDLVKDWISPANLSLPTGVWFGEVSGSVGYGNPRKNRKVNSYQNRGFHRWEYPWIIHFGCGFSTK